VEKRHFQFTAEGGCATQKEKLDSCVRRNDNDEIATSAFGLDNDGK
jgi:hypothetical protein